MRNPEMVKNEGVLKAELEDVTNKILLLEVSPEGHEDQLNELHARQAELEEELHAFDHTDQQAA